MSKIYLPNGASIDIYNAWKSSESASGMITLTEKETEKHLGTISPGGTAHLTSNCRHTYYPAPVNSLPLAYQAVMDNLRQLAGWQLKDLKKAMESFNAKEYRWK